MVSCDWRSRRQAIPSDHAYRCLIHDRSSIFSEDLDRDVKTFGVAVLKTPIRAPKANAYCARGSSVVCAASAWTGSSRISTREDCGVIPMRFLCTTGAPAGQARRQISRLNNRCK